MWPEMIGIALSSAALVGAWLRWLMTRQDERLEGMRSDLHDMDARLRAREATGATRVEMEGMRVELRDEIREGFRDLKQDIRDALARKE